MEQVKIGLMLPGAKSFEDHNVNPTWKAHVKTHESVVVAYVKQVDFQKLYAECVCATIGRSLGLSIPKPIIVKVTHDAFKEIPEGEYALAFGSEDAGYPSFRRYSKSEEALEKLKSYSKTLDVGVFDEWIANWDRNVGNILYDGGEKFSFIDHENALDLSLEESDSAKDNQIIRVIYTLKSEFEKHKLNRDIDIGITPQYKDFPFALISEKTYASSYLPQEQIVKVIEFLEKRSKHIKMLMSRRLGVQQQEMAL
ncbi:hypothetical protein G8770_19235 [Aestuariicella hydrocarbonica]|uniref:HipA-like kinase domain-containing protein n=1 Tax=Pseudomaricurvus hydrocarbonicus TaxID=1470433 RepID=A0A9E5MNU1_9GAMM|nr:HipA family kinase [Aestuariicella hydrocarbonica]NHO67686.1 hypothetical protein [Aestuariicella hydrocarbonica]